MPPTGRTDMTPLFPSSESGPSLEQPFLSRMSLDDRRITSSGTGSATSRTQPYGCCVAIDDKKMYRSVIWWSFRVNAHSDR